MTVAAALTQLNTVAQAATATLGVRANLIFAAPPDQIAAYPAIIHQWDSSTFDQFPFGPVATGMQKETAVISVTYLSGVATIARAHSAILAFVDAYRALIAANQNLTDSVRQIRLLRASAGMVEYNGNDFVGADLVLEADLYHATTWVEA